MNQEPPPSAPPPTTTPQLTNYTGFDPSKVTPSAANPPPKKRKLWLYLLIVVIIAIAAAAAYLLLKKSPTSAPSISANSQVNKSSPTWLTTPKDLGDLKLFSGSFNNETYFHYYQIGTTREGYPIILAQSALYESGAPAETLNTDIGYIVNKGGNYLLLNSSLSDTYKQEDSATQAKLILGSNIKLDSSFVVPGISISPQITLPNNSKVTLAQTEASIYSDFSGAKGYTINPDLKLVGTTSDGKLYLNSLLSADSTYSAVNYILFRSDFRVVDYKLNLGLKFVSDVPSIKWTDGSANTVKYSQVQGPICGQPDTHVIADGITADDLAKIGTANDGKPIYQFKSVDQPLEKAYFAADTSAAVDTLTPQKYMDDKDLILYQDVLGQYNVLVSENTFLTSC